MHQKLETHNKANIKMSSVTSGGALWNFNFSMHLNLSHNPKRGKNKAWKSKDDSLIPSALACLHLQKKILQDI